VSTLHIVFDLDDTLYPERSFALSGFRASAQWAVDNLGLSPAEASAMAGEMAGMMDAGHRGNLFGLALARYIPDHAPEHVSAVHEAYRRHQPEALSLFDDGAWALERYGSTGALGLVTDGHHIMQSGKVKALGIAPHFREIVYTGALGPDRAFHKPHPRAFELVAQALGAPGDRFVYIGDNPSKDFVAPNAMGWLTVWVDRPGGIHEGAEVAEGGAPQVTIATLRALPDVLGI